MNDDTTRLLAERDALRAEVEKLRAENAALAAWQCIHPDGKTGLTHDECGNASCAKDAAINALRAEVGSLTQQLKAGESFHAVAVQQRDTAWREAESLRAEVERLTGCLKRANDQAEHFERHWYLRGDEVEALRADAERLRDENAALAAWQCIHRDGKIGLTHNECGNASCAKDRIIAEAKGELERLRSACSRENDTISQTLGRALGYPRFADDQKNFPGATDADGVCVGDHVAASLADEAANLIRALRAEVEQLRAPVARPLAEWHEDMGPALWWHMPVEEGPWFGQPTDADWPGYHTHWTTCAVPLRASDDAARAAQEGKT